jgi:hypothetical protein
MNCVSRRPQSLNFGERSPAKVSIQTGDDDGLALVGQQAKARGECFAEELNLIHTDDLGRFREPKESVDAADIDSCVAGARMTDNLRRMT